MSAVPALPALDLVAEHCRNLSAAHVDGVMLSWSLGGYPSLNLKLAQKLMAANPPSVDQALDELATERYGPTAAPHARRSWTKFSEAFRQYPFDGGVVYECPVQYGPANLLYLKPTGYHATMVGLPYDDLTGWRGPYPAEVFERQFRLMADQWDEGMVELRYATDASPNPAAKLDDGIARAVGLHLRSVADQARFVMARNGLGGATSPERVRLLASMRQAVRDEISSAKALFALNRADPRIGFEASNQFYYLPQDLMEKAINCRYVLEGIERQADAAVK